MINGVDTVSLSYLEKLLRDHYPHTVYCEPARTVIACICGEEIAVLSNMLYGAKALREAGLQHILVLCRKGDY